MSKLASFLDELTDYELKAFHHFRYDEFLKGSKEKIMLEMEKRGIEPTNLSEQLKKDRAATLESQPNLCPRCLSEKFYTRHEIETISYSIATFETTADYKTCLVCHYSQEKDEKVGNTKYVNSIGFLWRIINRKR